MNSPPSVTFILPVFNGALFVAESIDSILSQSYKNWTLLILDNCSTDNTQEVCSHYLHDSRIHYLRHEKNLGLLGNLLKGIELTNTPYWCYVCHDDKFTDSSAIQTAFDLLESDSELAMVSSPLQWMDSQSRIFRNEAEPVSGKLDGDETNRLMLRRIRITYGVIMLARTEYVKPFAPDVKTQSVADVDLFITISKGRKVFIYEKPAYVIRFHKDNNSMRTFLDAKSKYELIAAKHKIELSTFEKLLQSFNNYKVGIGKMLFFIYLNYFRK